MTTTISPSPLALQPSIVSAPAHFCFDLETLAGDPSSAEAWMRRSWQPTLTWKDETIGNRFREAYKKKRERLALMNSAPIASIAMLIDGQAILLHALDITADHIEPPGVSVIGYGNEREMLKAAREYFNRCDENTIFIGHNIRRFDLVKLRHRMTINNVRLPTSLANPNHRTYDTMEEYSRKFDVDNRTFISLCEILEEFQMPNHKALISGEDVGQMVADRNWRDFLHYAAADVFAEYAVFLRMTGEVGE